MELVDPINLAFLSLRKEYYYFVNLMSFSFKTHFDNTIVLLISCFFHIQIHFDNTSGAYSDYGNHTEKVYV